MNEELRPAQETNPYVPSSNLRPAGSWLPNIGGLPVKLIVLGITAFLGGMFVLGMAPAAGSIDYTRDIPITEVIEYMMRANWLQVLQHGPTWILPVCAIGLVGYISSDRSASNKLAIRCEASPTSTIELTRPRHDQNHLRRYRRNRLLLDPRTRCCMKRH
jgi:hypothetical protein